MKYLYRFAGIAIVLLLSYWSIKPFFSTGFYPMHDDTQVARVYDLHTAMVDGQFPVRWVENLGYGYGYPIFTFYAPLAYYIGGIINSLGFDSLTATKMMICLGALLAGVSMYLFAKQFWGRVGGVVSALLYVYAPYHALNIYVRGAVAELWAYAFIPFLALGLFKIYQNHRPKKEKNDESYPTKLVDWSWISVSAFAYAAIIASHNLTAMMITPFLILYVLLLIISRRTIFLSVLLTLILGITVAAFYWLPVLFEMQFTNVQSIIGGGSDYHDHFVCLNQLWSGPWGYGGSVPGCMDGLSFKLGKIHVLFSFLSLVPLVFLRKKKFLFTTILLSFIGLLISLFFTLQYSQPIWDLLTPMAYFQFPWRFLAIASFFASFLGGAVLLLVPKRTIKAVIGIIFIALVIYVNYDVFVPSKIIQKTAADYTNPSELHWKTSKISDEYMPQGFQIPTKQSQVPTEKIVIDQRVAQILSEQSKTQQTSAIIQTTKATTAKINIAYFPAWHMKIDNKKVDFKNTSTGMEVQIPQGKHTLDVYFNQTPIEQGGDFLTLTGVLVLLAGIITQRKDHRSIAKNS